MELFGTDLPTHLGRGGGGGGGGGKPPSGLGLSPVVEAFEGQAQVQAASPPPPTSNGNATSNGNVAMAAAGSSAGAGPGARGQPPPPPPQLLEEEPEHLGVAGTTLAFAGKLKSHRQAKLKGAAAAAASKELRLELPDGTVRGTNGALSQTATRDTSLCLLAGAGVPDWSLGPRRAVSSRAVAIG